MQTNRIDPLSVPTNTVLHGDCISVMQSLPANSIDLTLTDPPYLVRYQDRDGRSIQNDSNSDWLVPAFTEAYRVLKQDHFMISFYGWTQVDKFFHAWRSAGFRIVGHLVFRKQYASKSRFLKYQHEQAYLLAKGDPALPEDPIPDVIDMPYSGNKLHPTQKPVAALKQLIETFSQKIRSAVLGRRCWQQRSSTAAISASNSILNTMQPPRGGCILMAFARVQNFTRRS
jgi:DNA modification methylase